MGISWNCAYISWNCLEMRYGSNNHSEQLRFVGLS